MLLLTFCSAVPAHAALSWTVQVVDANANSIGNGYCPIAVDSNNNPHIAYRGAPEARYASWNGSGWNIQTFTSDGGVFSSLALDSSGNPHVAYITGDKLKYASQNGFNWTIQTVTVDNNLPTFDTDMRLSLELDSKDTPYIMYYTYSSFVDSSIGGARYVNVKLAVWKNSRWSIEPVLASSNLGEFGNMVLDSNGYPHFLATQRRYLSAENPTLLSTILYVSWDGRDWNIQTVASDVNLANIGFLALSPHGFPSIVYIGGGVKYARWTGTAWESYSVDTPDTTRDASGPCYLALDSKGTPHISARVFLSGQMLYPGYTSTIMYATANITEPTEISSTFPLLIVSTAVIIGTVIAVIAYVWKKKTKHQAEDAGSLSLFPPKNRQAPSF
jgi:hypothetical protein